MAKCKNTLEGAVSGALKVANIPFQHECRLEERDDFGAQIRVDFLCGETEGFPCGFIVECRMQNGPGSTFQKTHALIARARRIYPLPTILVFVGDELDESLHFAQDQIDGNLKAAMNFAGFLNMLDAIRKQKKNGNNEVESYFIENFDPRQRKLPGFADSMI